MNIRMYNVNFGDCFLLSGNQENLIVDFGSDTPRISLARVANDIIENSVEKDLSVLLTHFHIDHINGFWNTGLTNRQQIKNVYLPDIFAMQNAFGKISFLQLQILHDIFESIVLQKRPVSISLYGLLSALVNIDTNIILLKRGDSFLCDEKVYQVLWPSFEDISVHKKVENAVIELLSKLNIIGISEQKIKISELDTVGLGVIDDFISALLEGYRALIAQNNSNVDLSRIEQTFNIMDDFIQEIAASLPGELVGHLKYRAGSMANQGNRLSIVFQDEHINNNSRILMTGDITASELNRIILNRKISPCRFRVSHKYRIIKAPHHATRSHFSNLLPDCEYMLLSNGYPNESHRRWGKISYQYGSFYGSHKNCTLFCTNTRCELFDLRSASNCNGCPNTSPNWTDLTL